jgi:exopolysaccharide production protein ExoY
VGISVAAARALEKHAGHTAARPRAWGLVALVERAFALMLLVALFPALAAVAAVVAVLSGRSPLVAIARAGRRGKCIWLIKLRTMWGGDDTASAGGSLVERIDSARVPEFKAESDPRVTSSFASFCRRYSIDEAPQLWHVVRGEMALVGPRPLTYEELDTYYGYDADEVLSIKPGLTGLWQVRGRNSLTYRERLELDLYLVRCWSPRLYLSILAATIPAVFSGRNAG